MKRPAPRGPEFAREIIEEMIAAKRTIPAIKKTAAYIIDRGNYTEEGKAVWRSFLTTNGKVW